MEEFVQKAAEKNQEQGFKFDEETCNALRQQYEDIQNGKRDIPKGTKDKEQALDLIEGLIKGACEDKKS